MERKVGETFRTCGVRLKVVLSNRINFCEGCFFYHSEHSCMTNADIGYCGMNYRRDNKDVIFKLVK